MWLRTKSRGRETYCTFGGEIPASWGINGAQAGELEAVIASTADCIPMIPLKSQGLLIMSQEADRLEGGKRHLGQHITQRHLLPFLSGAVNYSSQGHMVQGLVL